MKKTFLFFVLLSNFWAMAQEQTCTYRGILLDSLSLPVIDASISAFDAKNQSAGYTFSDKNGEFKLDMPCGKKYELEIEHLNYKSKIVKVDLQKSMREKISMATSSVGLKEIVAQGVQPITIKGDTIEYDAASFKSGTEENLEDILKKLPGLSVEDGKIYYQGKEMKSIKVEGREIFGGNQKLVTKNLPSDAVSKVQLNKKFKSNPFANSVQADEDFELNIVLEENKKNLVLGMLPLGAMRTSTRICRKSFFIFLKRPTPRSSATTILMAKKFSPRPIIFNFWAEILSLIPKVALPRCAMQWAMFRLTQMTMRALHAISFRQETWATNRTKI